MSKKYNLIVPLAGKGQRMIDGGFKYPKPLLLVGNRHIIDYSLQSINTSECNIIFIVRRDHIVNYAIDKILKVKFGTDATVVIAEQNTQGSVSSCLLAKQFINNELPLIIFCPDIYFEPTFVPSDEHFINEGFLLTFKANSPNYSYVQHNSNDELVLRTAEKMVISDNASVGVYCFKSGKLFIETAEKAIAKNQKDTNEYYVCPLYNDIISAGGLVKTQQVPIMYIMGTPEEMAFFKTAVFNYFLPRSFILCCDHSGFELKEFTKEILNTMKIDYVDCGCYTDDDCDYGDFIPQAIESRTYFPGALILGFCRSGQGVNIFANKYKNIRSVLITNAEEASLGIKHNAANFFAMPAGKTQKKEIKNIIKALMIEKFEGGRHQNRLQTEHK